MCFVFLYLHFFAQLNMFHMDRHSRNTIVIIIIIIIFVIITIMCNANNIKLIDRLQIACSPVYCALS